MTEFFCQTHASPETSFKEFLDNVLSSLTGSAYNNVYNITSREQAVQTILHVTSCPICSKATRINAYDEYVVRYKKLEEGAKLPLKAHPTDAGFDVYALYTTDLLPGVITEVPTGIALEMPPCLYATFEGRSSFHARGVHTNRGVIDADYRGEVSPFMINNTSELITIKRWERCAQLVFHYQIPVKLVVSHELTPTERGTGRKGSTGQF
jgi:dUTP pyrophosphatase